MAKPLRICVTLLTVCTVFALVLAVNPGIRNVEKASAHEVAKPSSATELTVSRDRYNETTVESIPAALSKSLPVHGQQLAGQVVGGNAGGRPVIEEAFKTKTETMNDGPADDGLPEEIFEPQAEEPPVPEETPASRYASLDISDSDLDLIAKLVYHEARGETAEGQQAVAEVVFNRVMSELFPNTVYDVVYQRGQFSPAHLLAGTSPTEDNYAAVYRALHGEYVLPVDVLYFSVGAMNSNVWGSIGDHVFCYQY